MHELAVDLLWQGDMEDQAEFATGDPGKYGRDAQILSQAKVCRCFPFVDADLIAGSFSPNVCHANRRLAAPTFGPQADTTALENSKIVDIHKDTRNFHVVATVLRQPLHPCRPRLCRLVGRSSLARPATPHSRRLKQSIGIAQSELDHFPRLGRRLARL